MWDSLNFEGGTKRFKDIMQTVTATPYEAGEKTCSTSSSQLKPGLRCRLLLGRRDITVHLERVLFLFSL